MLGTQQSATCRQLPCSIVEGITLLDTWTPALACTNAQPAAGHGHVLSYSRLARACKMAYWVCVHALQTAGCRQQLCNAVDHGASCVCHAAMPAGYGFG